MRSINETQIETKQRTELLIDVVAVKHFISLLDGNVKLNTQFTSTNGFLSLRTNYTNPHAGG